MAGTTGRLLIVDDESGVTNLIENIAVQAGFEVLSIHDSDEYEKALQKFKPTIIFLDVSMPGRDGMELVGHLAACGYPGKIVMMSGDPAYVQMTAAIATARGLTLAGTLQKPFRKQSVLDLLLNPAVATD